MDRPGTDRLPKKITKTMLRYGIVATIDFVATDHYTLIYPVEVHIQHDKSDDEWVASYDRAGIASGGKTPREAFEAMRGILVGHLDCLWP